MYWTEVLTATHGWITVDIVHGRINCVGEMESLCKKPILYIVAVNNDGTVKDLTKKYVSPSTYLTQTRKLRVSQEWLDQVLDPFKARLTPEEKAENEKIEKHLMVNFRFFLITSSKDRTVNFVQQNAFGQFITLLLKRSFIAVETLILPKLSGGLGIGKVASH